LSFPITAFAVAQDINGYFPQLEKIRKMDWDTYVGGHVTRTSTHADVDLQTEFLQDNTLTPKWSTRLAGFDTYIWDQCYSM
jgi:hypothetical protein